MTAANAQEEKVGLQEQLQTLREENQSLLLRLDQVVNDNAAHHSIGDNGCALVTIIETSQTGLPTKKEIVVSPALLQ